MQQLQAKGLSPHFHLLDICNLQSIRALRDFLLKEYGGLDVLVNTPVGITFRTSDPTPLPIQAEVTMKTNFFGTRDVCMELLPLVRPQAPSREYHSLSETASAEAAPGIYHDQLVSRSIYVADADCNRPHMILQLAANEDLPDCGGPGCSHSVKPNAAGLCTEDENSPPRRKP
ncbi:Carbonyl reductase [NADPH] 1 [Manis javanica]|nr:Carbonyl reductase [NADPH] 1 [Manis javanica]